MKARRRLISTKPEESMKSISRRSFCWTAAVGSLALPSLARAQSRYAMEHVVIEWSYSSQKPYKDPFNELELDVEFQLIERIFVRLLGGVRPFYDDMLHSVSALSPR